MDTIIQALEKRYAVKLFDEKFKLTRAQVNQLKVTVNLTASSMGLQPYRVVVVENQKIKEELRRASYDQAQVSTASHLFIFCAHTQVDSAYADEFLNDVAQTRQVSRESLEGLEGMVKGFTGTASQEDKIQWAARQAYIAVGNLLTSAAIAGIDACPMEGFDAQSYAEILQLEEKNLQPFVMVALGKKSDNDKYAQLKKVRKTLDDMFLDF